MMQLKSTFVLPTQNPSHYMHHIEHPTHHSLCPNSQLARIGALDSSQFASIVNLDRSQLDQVEALLPAPFRQDDS